jgi:hypothetical protein
LDRENPKLQQVAFRTAATNGFSGRGHTFAALHGLWDVMAVL